MSDELVRAMAVLAEELGPGDVDRTLQQITAAAVRLVPGADLANITVRHEDGRLETVAATDDLLLELDAAQYDLREGPCYDAATDEAFVTSPDLATDPRYPRYGPRAVRAGIHAQAGLRLFETPGLRARGALNLFSRDVGALGDIETIAPLFTHQAAVALTYAREVSDLQQALSTRRQIGMAVGIVMQRFGLDEQKAFGFLSRLSQDQNIKLRDVAARLVADSQTSPG